MTNSPVKPINARKHLHPPAPLLETAADTDRTANTQSRRKQSLLRSSPLLANSACNSESYRTAASAAPASAPSSQIDSLESRSTPDLRQTGAILYARRFGETSAKMLAATRTLR